MISIMVCHRSTKTVVFIFLASDRPVIHNVLLSDSRRYFPADISNSQPVAGMKISCRCNIASVLWISFWAAAYYTPQIKRKRIEQGTNNLPNDLVTTQLDSIQKLMAEINRKMDTMSKRENEVEKRLDNFDKRIVGLVRRVNKVMSAGFSILLIICRWMNVLIDDLVLDVVKIIV